MPETSSFQFLCVFIVAGREDEVLSDQCDTEKDGETRDKPPLESKHQVNNSIPVIFLQNNSNNIFYIFLYFLLYDLCLVINLNG